MGLFAKSKVAFLQGFLKLENGVPSHDTCSRLFHMLGPEQFRAAFQRFMGWFLRAMRRDCRTHCARFTAVDKDDAT